HRERDLISPRQLVDDEEADVVARVAVLATRIAQTDDQLHELRNDSSIHRHFFSFSFAGASSSFSVLPFLITSGSAVVATAASAATAGASSTFGMMMCTSIVSGSVIGFHLRLSGRSRTRTDCPSIS